MPILLISSNISLFINHCAAPPHLQLLSSDTLQKRLACDTLLTAIT